ncbi:MAG: malate synthase G [Dehalococcoidia bacterium]
MNVEYIEIKNIKIAKPLYDLVDQEIIPDTGISSDKFWTAFGSIVNDLEPDNRLLLNKRSEIQENINSWHNNQKTNKFNIEEYKTFLKSIGYLAPDAPDFQITTTNVDEEISSIAGPQLVVPVDNARFAINAANARWWSLYDSLYGTDIISEENNGEKGTSYNPHRGAKVVAYCSILLDSIFGLQNASFAHASNFSLKGNDNSKELVITLSNEHETRLVNPSNFVGYIENDEKKLTSILLKNNGLHIEIQIDRNHPIGTQHSAGIKDVLIESAITTIQDFEDSVAAVDVFDKVIAYRNWNELMKGTCTSTLEKDGNVINRTLNPDKNFQTPKGEKLTLHGRSLLLVRNVGIHMYTNAVTNQNGEEIPEGFLDAMITSLAALHDINGKTKYSNSRTKSMYIVKPKMHGPDEVAFTVKLFERIEEALGLENNTLKIGIMDEERRTTVNLKQCIYEAKERIIFINTGFLDRTGDEIHTSMEAGPVLPKGEIRNQPWIKAYEDQNVDIGIESGLVGIAQIGKGMWAMPDEMKAMMAAKISHPESGANTAWVPSPTAAALHAIHYHMVNVNQIQKDISTRDSINIDEILTPPLMDKKLSESEILQELENNAQGILGYVSRWVGQGIGCSKIPDINNIGLMEDRATLRISSQHISNWLYHNITSQEEVITVFKKMAKIVDDQNKDDNNYIPMSKNFDSSIEFQAALDLVFLGRKTTNGYTEPVLHTKRAEAKNRK